MKALGIALLCSFSLLFGCKIAHGPVLRNQTRAAAEFWADYTNGEKSYVRLEAGTSLWKGKKGFVPTRIVVLQNEVRFEFDSSYLQRLFTQFEKLDDSVFVFDGVKLDVLSMKEAQKLPRLYR